VSRQEIWSVVATVAVGVVAIIVATTSMRNNSVLGLAVSVGALGGLVHEIAQSGGKILFFQRHDDGLYLGSVAGMVLGAVAGILIVRGHFTGEPTDVRSDASMVQLAYEVFTAGLALKGVTEAAGGNPVRSSAGPTPPAG